MVGNVGIGGDNPIRVQSMITSDTRDTAACVAEVLGLADVGCEIVRITAQTKVYAANLENIAREVRAAGCQVPLVADIHFKPDAALEAAKWVEKVRVNPGNYADKKKFEIREYSDDQYEEELERIREEFTPLVHLCKELGRAMRIGTNHGSLSDRIMNRYGDTPLGMVESALEFARIARDHDYHALVFSMKASNPKVMIEAYRLLVARLNAEGADWNYPIHLGVTEAGDGEDGRIKSAIGIGSLLADGIGDTIRVSLTEDSIHEIPVAQALVEPYNRKCGWDDPVPARGREQPVPTSIHCAHAIRPDWSQLEKRTSTYLPHWRIPGATYAVTFRVKDSLPAAVLKEYERKNPSCSKRCHQEKQRAGSRDTIRFAAGNSQRRSKHSLNPIIEPALHAADGPQPLADPAIARMMLQSLKHFDGVRYDLFAWSVMPNHVHALLTPHEGHELGEDSSSDGKPTRRRRANRMLGTTGTFWQEEYYDHIVRDGEDLKHQVTYILGNPGKGRASAEWTGAVFGEVGTGCPNHGLGADRPSHCIAPFTPSYDPFSYERRRSSPLTLMGHALGGDNTVRVFTTQERWNALAHKISAMGDFKPEIIVEKSGVVEIDPNDEAAVAAVNSRGEPCLVTVSDQHGHGSHPGIPLVGRQGRRAASHPAQGHAFSHLLKTGIFYQPCCPPRRISARCFATASAMRFWSGAKPRPASRCGSPTTSCRPPAPGSSRPTMSPARAAGAPCSTSSTPPGRSARPPAISRACGSR